MQSAPDFFVLSGESGDLSFRFVLDRNGLDALLGLIPNPRAEVVHLIMSASVSLTLFSTTRITRSWHSLG